MCSWHPRRGNASLNIYKKKAVLITKKKNPLPGKKPRWEFAEAGGNGPFTRKSFSSAFKWNWEAGGDGEVSQSLSVLLIDKMTLILPRITGIRSGNTYLAITQPSNTKHLLPLDQLLSEITYAGRRPCMAQGVLCFRNYSQWKTQRYIFISFSASPPQASETSSLWCCCL